MIHVVLYQDKYGQDFKRLNLEWLEKYHLTEPYDLEILNDPQGAVIDKGGFIFIALDDDKVVGTAGLSKNGHSEYELVKMTVDPAARGKGLGKMLLAHCIETAKKVKAVKIILFSNSRLLTALKLYEKYGFIHVEVSGTPLLTADVKMELSLIPD